MNTQAVHNKYLQFLAWCASIDALIFLLAALMLNRITDWLPETIIHPFPFYNIGLTWQYYFYFIDLHVCFILFWNFCYKSIPKYAQLFYFFRAVEIVSLIDFMIIYEKPFMYLGAYGLEFTDLKIFVYFSLYILWKTGKS